MKLFITENELDLYAEISNDKNAIHLKHTYAQAHGFKDRVVHGMLVVSLITQKFDEENIHKMQHKFIKPIYINQSYLIKSDDCASFISVKVIDENNEVKLVSKLFLEER